MTKAVNFSHRILPVCLPSGRNIDPGDKLIVTGWGATGGKKLRKMQLNLKKRSQI